MKKILLVLVPILIVLLNTSVYGDDLDGQKTSSILISKDQNFDNENNLFIQSRQLEIEKEILIQKQKIYDTFLLQQQNTLSKFMIIVSILGIILTFIIGIIAFLGYRFFKDLKQTTKRELEDKINEKRDADRDYINKIYEGPLLELTNKVCRLEGYIEYLKKFLKRSEKDIPNYIDEEEGEKFENIFEEE